MILLTGSEDHGEDLMPSLTRNLKTCKAGWAKPDWNTKARPKSADSSSTEASEAPIGTMQIGSEINQRDIEIAFFSLANENRDFGGSRNINGFTEISICCVKQFFLDSYLCSGTLWQSMRTAFGAKMWINLTEFSKAYEVLQVVSVNSGAKFGRKDNFMQNFLSNPYEVQFKLAEAANKGPLAHDEFDQIVKTTRVSIGSLQRLRSCFDI